MRLAEPDTCHGNYRTLNRDTRRTITSGTLSALAVIRAMGILVSSVTTTSGFVAQNEWQITPTLLISEDLEVMSDMYKKPPGKMRLGSLSSAYLLHCGNYIGIAHARHITHTTSSTGHRFNGLNQTAENMAR